MTARTAERQRAQTPAPPPGLTGDQARATLARVGPNLLADAEPPHWLLRLARNFTHLFALLLWAGAGLALLGGQRPLAVAILAVIVVNAVFSFAQEFRAERAVAALKEMLPDAELEITGAGYGTDGEVRPLSGTLDRERFVALARAGVLCNDSILRRRGGHWEVVGDPTEGALITLARRAGLDPDAEADAAPRVAEAPFDSNRQRMTTVHASRDGLVGYAKGAPIAIVERSRLAPSERRAVLDAADRLARQSLRVLALARRRAFPSDVPTDELEQELELLGLVGMEDPPRP